MSKGVGVISELSARGAETLGAHLSTRTAAAAKAYEMASIVAKMAFRFRGDDADDDAQVFICRPRVHDLDKSDPAATYIPILLTKTS